MKERKKTRKGARGREREREVIQMDELIRASRGDFRSPHVCASQNMPHKQVLDAGERRERAREREREKQSIQPSVTQIKKLAYPLTPLRY